ncbi:MAG: Uma2 family endonuclease [Byssovorax sp.]
MSSPSSSWTPGSAWTVDPDDPRAPPEDVWDALTPAERKRIVDSLPSEFPFSEAQPPEGDAHFKAKTATREVLDGYFARVGRLVYVACELPIYYPDERLFAPDVLAVVDVATHERKSWVVKDEGKGLDLAIEVLVSGKRRKDLEDNVARYARLGIAEYFVFDRARLRLHGYRLPQSTARVYQPIVPQGGFYASRVLGLDLRLEGTRQRFFHGAAAIPDASELITSLEKMVDEVELRIAAAEERAQVADEQVRAAEEQARAAEEQARSATAHASEVERRLADALAQIARLEAERSRG